MNQDKNNNGAIKREFMIPGRTNEEDRINFIKFWVNYMKTHSDKEWSEQQNLIIDSVAETK